MSNVFYIDDNDRGDINNQLASVAYVNSTVKKLQDIITKYISTTINPQDINFTDSVDILPIPKPELNININATDVNTDSNHKFISETEISVLKDKPTTYDVDKSIAGLKKEIIQIINERFDNILNSKNSLNNIKYLINVLENDNNMKNILDLINSKASLEDLEEHKESFTHVNNIDRKAINLLIKFIEKGCSDWNADKDQPNYIRNKPDSLPANGGDADTVSGYTTDYLINKQSEDLIIGTPLKGYTEEEVDIMISSIEDAAIVFNKMRPGLYFFRKGKYIIDSISIKNNDGEIIIKGSGNNTIFIGSNGLRVGKNCSINNLCIEETSVNIFSQCKFNNVTFKDCCISFLSSEEITITNCTFENCSFIFNGACFNNLIIGCRFKNTNPPVYTGGNNLFTNNISY